MAIVMVLEVPGASTEQYDQVNEAIGVYSSADAPDGLISHVCAVTDKGLVICDVWSSPGGVGVVHRVQDRAGDAESRAVPRPAAVRTTPPPARETRLTEPSGNRPLAAR